jgi:DNA modification methylase
LEELGSHPTVKPVALVADAIRDVSHRGELVLDTFGGSGTTLIAAEKTGRIARLIELDPIYAGSRAEFKIGGFPGTRNDDQADSTSQALDRMHVPVP